MSVYSVRLQGQKGGGGRRRKKSGGREVGEGRLVKGGW